ncbi:MAG: hypothetical protein NVSMB62_13160 [Acidobacteriaceae bacterium]
MAKLTMVFGVLLVVLGAWGYIGTGHAHPTALIPCFFGLVLGLCGYLANHEDAKRRMLWMHVAVTIGLLGFLGTSPAIVGAVRLMQGTEFPHPEAVEEKAAMAVLCLVFVGMCVVSFIRARRGRVAV